MDILNRYGTRRVAEIAAKVARCRVALPVATEVQHDVQTAPKIEQPRPIFTEANPAQKERYMLAQRRFFACANAAKLAPIGELRLAGVNALLGLSLDTTRRATPDELHLCADAIERGAFSSDWSLNAAPDVIDEDAPLPDAPPEVEPIETDTTPAPLESLDEQAMEFDLAQMRAADKARQRTAIYAEKILLETRLNELEHALLAV